jgi:Tfp pilus assembly protein PilN
LLNLSPPEVRAHTSHHRKFGELVTVGALAFGVLAVGAVVLGMQLFRERRAAGRITQVLSEIEPAAKRVQEKTRSAQLVDGVLERRRRLAAHLSSILRHLPSDAVLETFTFERGRRELVVRGNAGSTQTVLEYIKQLERIEGIGQVQLKYSTRRSTAAGERTDFELVMRQQEGA